MTVLLRALAKVVESTQKRITLKQLLTEESKLRYSTWKDFDSVVELVMSRPYKHWTLQQLDPNIVHRADGYHENKLDADVVKNVQKVASPDALPPIIAVPSTQGYKVLDGAHRLTGVKKKGFSFINAWVPASPKMTEAEVLETVEQLTAQANKPLWTSELADLNAGNMDSINTWQRLVLENLQ